MIIPQISEFYSKFPVLECAFLNNFHIHHDFKIPVKEFLLSFFDTVENGSFSWTEWAQRLSLQLQEVFCANGLRQKGSFRHLPFFQNLFFEVLGQCFKHPGLDADQDWGPWRRVWVTDSSCFSLPESMATVFPGPHSKKGKCATAKIQLTMDLKTGDIGLLELASFRENDQSYSPNIFGVAQPGDLCIRDLGYSVCKVFDDMNKKSIHFISRLQYGIKVYDIKGNRINLTSYLRKSFRNGAKKIDRQVLISAEKIPVRLVVFKRSEAEYQLKREQRIKDRHTNTAHDKDYYERLRYCIYIANVDSEIAPAETIRSLYRLRWRIEILFYAKRIIMQSDAEKVSVNQSIPYVTSQYHFA